jgi:hypothetical protein
MAGLDPAIHQAKLRMKWMDCRVKPGNDGMQNKSAASEETADRFFRRSFRWGCRG